MIQPIESLEITVLVDNGTDSLSTNPGFVETEMAGAWRRGMIWLSGRCLCCAAHGLSCLITTRTPSSQHTLLFDTGPDESIFERNVIRLGVAMGGVDAMMLSHGHWDHAGAMPRALQMMTLPVRLHGLFARRPDQCSHARGGAVSRHPPLWRLPPGWPDRGDHSGDRRRARGLRPPADRRGALHRLAGVGTTRPAVRGSRRPVGGRKALCAVGTRGRRSRPLD
jgi:hypothetical protein